MRDIRVNLTLESNDNKIRNIKIVIKIVIIYERVNNNRVKIARAFINIEKQALDTIIFKRNDKNYYKCEFFKYFVRDYSNFVSR